MDLLRTKLEENEKLKLREVIPNDGNSFFRCCSDQLKRLNLVPMDHIELRQKVAKRLETYSDVSIGSANFYTKRICSLICQYLFNGKPSFITMKNSLSILISVNVSLILNRSITVFSLFHLKMYIIYLFEILKQLHFHIREKVHDN